MRKTITLLASIFIFSFAQGQAWITEIHYDNVGDDANERIEIFAPAGTSLNGWSVYLYNGNGGITYGSSISLTGLVVPNQGTFDNLNYGTIVLSFPQDGIQNGSPDGIALVNSGVVVEFLSYEGSFIATNGPANGLTSVDIGVSENGTTTTADGSLQRSNTGSTWIATSSSNTFGAINSGFDVLPVNHYNFGVSYKNKNAVLKWEAYTSHSTIYFEIEKSTDGRSFSKAGMVNAKGIGDFSYEYTDAHPGTGFVYYRLKMVDYDGKITYSEVARLKITGDKNVFINNIYPAPATDVLNVQINSQRVLVTVLSIIDLQGRMVKQKLVQLQPGNLNYQLHLKDLIAGNYFLRLQLDDEIITKPFIKQ